jgi:hypothetical protein
VLKGRKMKDKKALLLRFLEYVDKQTYWKQDNDVTNNQIVDEFLTLPSEFSETNASTGVSQQRELLIAFYEWEVEEDDYASSKKEVSKVVDRYLSNTNQPRINHE